MNVIRKLTIVVMHVLFLASMLPAQMETVDWFRKLQIYREPLYVRSDLVANPKLKQFHERLELIYPKDDSGWSGRWHDDLNEVGFSQLIWNNDEGYVRFYVDTCVPELRHFDYGSVIENADSVIVQSAAQPGKKKYVKVKWGPREYLVNEMSLRAFAEKAVGLRPLSADSAEQKWSDYWVRGDLEPKLSGYPVFPASYFSFQLKPVSVQILSVGRRSIVSEYQSESVDYTVPSALYHVRLNGGRNVRLVKGLTLSILETGDEVMITHVGAATASGVIIRTIADGTKEDYCVSDQEEPKPIACPSLHAGLKATSQTGRFLY